MRVRLRLAVKRKKHNMSEQHNLAIVDADLNDEAQSQAIVTMLDQYAHDLMGGGDPLSEYCKANLVRELRALPHAHVVLAIVDATPVGLSICFEGFSTFQCRPLMNIHDFAVKLEYRGRGIARRMLQHIERLSSRLGCCKMTLEVLSNNHPACQLYATYGFEQYSLDPQMGGALFLQKQIAR